MIDHVTEAYVKECLEDGGELRGLVGRATFPPRYFECFGQRMMPRPFFVAEPEIRQAADDLRSVFEILVSLPDRLFDGDLDRYCAAVGFDPASVRLMRRMGGGRPTMFGRSDLYHDGTSLKLLEFNVGSQLGGIDQCQVLPAMLEVDAFQAFAQRHRISYVHTGERIAASIRAAAEPVSNGDAPVVALLEADGALAKLHRLLSSFQEMLRGCGLDVRLAELSQVREKDGKLYLDGTPVDAVLRYFSVNQLRKDPNGESAVEPVFRAHEAGGTVLFTTLESFLYSNKACLALLSDRRWREAYSAGERELIDRVVPWTRDVVPGPTEVRGDQVDLVEYCRDQRERLILKPRNDFGGNGIVMGWLCGDAEWRAALGDALDRGYVVQERVVQRREPVVDPDTGQLQDWVCLWSTFLTPDGFAGSHIRALPADQTGIISRDHNAATRVTGVFLHP